MQFGGWDQTHIAFFTPPSTTVTNHFPPAFTFMKRDLFGEHNMSRTALFSLATPNFNGPENKNVTKNYVGEEENSSTIIPLFSQCFYPLIVSQMTNFGLCQTERVCRRQFTCGQKWQKVFQRGRKHCGKRRNCSLQEISPFPTVFSKGLYCRHVKTRACLGKG